MHCDSLKESEVWYWVGFFFFVRPFSTSTFESFQWTFALLRDLRKRWAIWHSAVYGCFFAYLWQKGSMAVCHVHDVPELPSSAGRFGLQFSGNLGMSHWVALLHQLPNFLTRIWILFCIPDTESCELGGLWEAGCSFPCNWSENVLHKWWKDRKLKSSSLCLPGALPWMRTESMVCFVARLLFEVQAELQESG